MSKRPVDVQVTFLPENRSLFPLQKVFLVDEDSARNFFINYPSYMSFKVFVVNESKMTIKVVDNFADAIEFFKE